MTNYTITIEGNIATSKNDTTGQVIFTGTDVGLIINDTIRYLTPGRTQKEKVTLIGNFPLNDTIIMTSYTIIELQGKVAMEPWTNRLIISGNSVNNFEVIGGEWDGNKTNQSGTGTNLRGFEFVSCSDYIIDRVMIHDCIRDNICNNYGTRFTVTNCTSYNSSSTGLAMNFANDSKAINNIIHDCDAGLYLYTQLDNIVQTCDRNTISNNFIYNIVRDGISLYPEESTDSVRWNTVSNNVVINAGTDTYHTGIGIGWSDRAGVGYADNNTCTGNLVYATGYYNNGHHILVKGHNNMISDNVIYNAYREGIYVAGDYNTIIRNSIEKTRADSAFGIELVDANHNTIENNYIHDTGHNAIFLTRMHTSGCSYNEIKNNKINRSANYWLSIGDAGSIGNIINNNFWNDCNDVLDRGTGTIFNNNVNVSTIRVNRPSPCDGLGDINQDGYVTLEDTNLVARIILGSYTPNSEEFRRADIDKDNYVTMQDALKINQFVNELIDTFPGCTVQQVPPPEIRYDIILLLVGFGIAACLLMKGKQ